MSLKRLRHSSPSLYGYEQCRTYAAVCKLFLGNRWSIVCGVISYHSFEWIHIWPVNSCSFYSVWSSYFSCTHLWKCVHIRNIRHSSKDTAEQKSCWAAQTEMTPFSPLQVVINIRGNRTSTYLHRMVCFTFHRCCALLVLLVSSSVHHVWRIDCRSCQDRWVWC
jgi:hypothetical protein